MTITTTTLEVPGAVLTYDVRPADRPAIDRPLVMIGSPMGAAGFHTLAGHLTDRTVVTYDPRGVERSRLVGSSDPATPDTHAADLHALVATIGGGPVDVFASSGGAVYALAWVAAHPDDWADRPLRDPATFGLPTEDDGSRDDPLFSVNMATFAVWEPDLDALRTAPSRIVLGVGEESTGQMTARSTEALADLLGLTPVVFPSGHAGFLGGEYGQTGEPDAFARTLREVLEAA